MQPVQVVVDSGFPWVQATSVISTTVIGMAVAYVAWRQHRITQLQLRQALFDKRYSVYKASWAFITTVLLPDVDDHRFKEDEAQFMRAWHESQFLFPDPRIPAALDALRTPAYNLRDLKNNLENIRASDPSGARPETAQQKTENFAKQKPLRERLQKERESLASLFMPHLRLPERL